MAKSKYNKETFPVLARDWARQGFSDAQVAKKLGISKGTLYNYCKQHSEFKAALSEGKEIVDALIEDTLIKRVMGYEYIETTTTKRGDKVVEEKETTKMVLPNPDLIKFYLINRRKDRWRLRQDLKHEFDLENLPEDLLDKILDKIIKGDV